MNLSIKRIQTFLIIVFTVLLTMVLVACEQNNKNGEGHVDNNGNNTGDISLSDINPNDSNPIGSEFIEFYGSDRLLVDGDLEHTGFVEDWISLVEVFNMTYENESILGFNTVSLLNQLGVQSNEFDLYLKADDGFMIKLDGSTLDETFIGYHSKLGWCFVSDKHPVNSKIKHLKECILVADSLASGFNIIANDENHFVSIGSILMSMDRLVQLSDGVSTYNDISIDVMKEKSLVSFIDLLSEQIYDKNESDKNETDKQEIEKTKIMESQSRLIMLENGLTIYEYGEPGYLEVNLSKVNYISADYKETYIDVSGIIVSPPKLSIKDHYIDATYYLDKDIRVMTLFLDGFSYWQYLEILNDGERHFLDSIEQVDIATSFMKPVTNVGFSAMITGQDPSVSGIHDRSDRMPEVPTIFDYKEGQVKTGLIEGNVQILQVNTDTRLNLDLNENGMTDDEIFESAKEALLEDFDYLMVHFHSIDEFGHEFGPYSDRTIEHIKVIDEYVEYLADNWNGKIIITADHGMHETELGGDHGDMNVEDLYVPYMIINGGKYEQE